MNSLTAAQYQSLSNRRKIAFQKIAKELGDKHPVTVAMGELAWGRHDKELGAHNSKSLRAAAEEFGALEGYACILKRVAAALDDKSLRVICDLLPTGYNGKA